MLFFWFTFLYFLKITFIISVICYPKLCQLDVQCFCFCDVGIINTCDSSHSCRQWVEYWAFVIWVVVSSFNSCLSLNPVQRWCCTQPLLLFSIYWSQLVIMFDSSDVDYSSFSSFAFVVYWQGSNWSQQGQHHSHSAWLACQGAEPLPLRGVEAQRGTQVGYF